MCAFHSPRVKHADAHIEKWADGLMHTLKEGLMHTLKEGLLQRVLGLVAKSIFGFRGYGWHSACHVASKLGIN